MQAIFKLSAEPDGVVVWKRWGQTSMKAAGQLCQARTALACCTDRRHQPVACPWMDGGLILDTLLH